LNRKVSNDDENLHENKGWLEKLQYPASEDIYSKEEKFQLADEELPEMNGSSDILQIAEDLDVPGTELDDMDEEIGEEDEENNYYSLGGGDHDDLEESIDD